ncbi:hypothetical protein CRG98_032121 [Punica granatum]|uniref:Reverse transcriptase domain-containing protein n=1 Tax=Punica granatum TaxID=22663 RepID=A0A2I0IU67_PUNGR|nr:hypothetical protein CRG98_032121 [Punica granatum]
MWETTGKASVFTSFEFSFVFRRSARWFLLGAKLTQLPIVEMLDEIWININLRVTISSSLTADSNPKTAVLSLHRSLMLRLREMKGGANTQRCVRPMRRMFAKQLGRNVEAYVDDMIVKSSFTVDHYKDLEEIFAKSRKYQMKLNPKKCAFGVQFGKFLGFMITQRARASGVGSMLIPPVGEPLSYALILTFPATNNEAKYEVVVTELLIANGL